MLESNKFPHIKASRLIFTLLLTSSVAIVQLAAQHTKADRKSIEEVRAKAEAGDAEFEEELGVRYEHGKGVTKDQLEALKWYRKAAEQNYARAQIISASASPMARHGEVRPSNHLLRRTSLHRSLGNRRIL